MFTTYAALQENPMVFVSSLDPSIKFSQWCEALSTHGQGCQLRAPCSLARGTRVHLDILRPISYVIQLPENGELCYWTFNYYKVTAHVGLSKPMSPGGQAWALLELEYDNPRGFWGIARLPQERAAMALEK